MTADETIEEEIEKTERRVDWSLLVSAIALCVSVGSYLNGRETIKDNRRAAEQTQRTAIFSQFQQQYNSVSSNFPHGYLSSTFRPRYGTDDYGRLQAYWFFCFSEWYATHRVNNQAVGTLWNDYYAPLIADGLRVNSLRYVLEDRIKARGSGDGDWNLFLRELRDIAQAHQEPLSKDTVNRINGVQTAELGLTDISFASTKKEKSGR